jgi:ABC-type lipoprotein export system ATPase subunit
LPPDDGRSSIGGQPTDQLDDAGRARLRAERIGIVLQSDNLISFLTSNQVWGLSKSDLEWSTALETALLTSRRDDLKHGTNAAYVAGCVCDECREHQRQRMARNR